jgi:hypothetical protein
VKERCGAFPAQFVTLELERAAGLAALGLIDCSHAGYQLIGTGLLRGVPDGTADCPPDVLHSFVERLAVEITAGLREN